MKTPIQILFLAIDAGDKFLLHQWAQDGTLPVIRSLLARGLVGETKSVDGFYEGSTWPSFYTGVNPARHGFHYLTQIKPGSYEFHPCYPGDIVAAEPFWNRLSRSGKTVAILDVPLTGASKNLNGIQMVEWGSHDAAYGFHTSPTGLKKDVLRRFGTHPVGKACDAYGRSAEEFCQFKDDLIKGVIKKTELTLHYLKQRQWDFFAQVFTEGHCAGHQCWHLHDPAHPNYDRNIVCITGDPIRDVYHAIDNAIGRILAQVDEKTIVFLLASHRMARNIGASFLLEDILQKMNVLKRSQPIAASRPQQGIIRKLASFAKEEWNQLPSPMQSALRPVIFPLYAATQRCFLRNNFSSLSARLDLKNSMCFPHNNGNLVSGIRINLLGREPNGLIKPGQELDDLCRTIAADLLTIVEKRSGKPAVNRVLRAADLFRGEYIDHLPDLLVEWSENHLIGSKGLSANPAYRLNLISDKIGTIEGDYTYCRTGDHRPEGLLIVFGRGIPSGVMKQPISIMDFAPTFLKLFGLDSPNLDGKPISEISTNG